MSDLPTDEAHRALEAEERARDYHREVDDGSYWDLLPDDQRDCFRESAERLHTKWIVKTAGGAGEMRERAAHLCEVEAGLCVADIVDGDEAGSRLAHERASALLTAADDIRFLPLDPSLQGEGGGGQGATATPSGSHPTGGTPDGFPSQSDIDPSRRLPKPPRGGPIEDRSYSSIRRGLEDALAFAEGDESRATLRTFVVQGDRVVEVPQSTPGGRPIATIFRSALAQAKQTLAEARANDERAQREDPKGLSPKDASVVTEGQAPNNLPTAPRIRTEGARNEGP